MLTNANIFGFTHIDSLSLLKLDEIEYDLLDRGVDLNNVIYSIWDSIIDGCLWVVASDEELDDEEIKEALNFIIENEVEDLYLLGRYGS